jgi:cell division protein FtsI (penicillin-binding protein 3)
MSPVKKLLLKRVAVVYGILFVLSIMIFVRLINLKVGEKEKWKSEAHVIKEKDILPKRGNIYSCNGKLLASSIPYYDLRVDFSKSVIHDTTFKKYLKPLSQKLSGFFQDKSEFEYEKAFKKARRKGSRYFLLKKSLTYMEMKTVKTFPIFNKGQFLGGLIVERNEKRVQPHGRLAHRAIGYKKEDGTAVGIEGAFDGPLSGYKGSRMMQMVSGYKWIPLNETNIEDPTPGQDIISTIDVRFQDIADEELERQLKINGARHGSVVIMEVKTGEIKAIVNLKEVGEGKYYEYHNSAIGENLEPGSTFKLASLMVALEDGKFSLKDSIDTKEGKHRFYDRVMKDSKRGGYGKISVKDVIAYSSNVGIAQLINKHYKKTPQRFIDRLYSFGLGEKTGIEIKGEEPPSIRSPKSSKWSGTSLPWMSLGYAVQLSPLQTLNLYNTVANDGVMMKPHIVKALSVNGEIVEEFKPEVVRSSICSHETIRSAKKALEAVVEYGTGRMLKNDYMKVAGKTGTAQIANAKFGYSSETTGVSHLASFAGYYPADDPKYSCMVVIHSPKKQGYYATKVAVPVFKRIMERIYALEFSRDIAYDLKHKNNLKFNSGKAEDYKQIGKELELKNNNNSATWVKPKANYNYLNNSSIKIENNVVPNFIGMGLRDALNLVEKQGMKLRIRGKGKVAKQSIKAGTMIRNKNQIIYLTLNE